MSRAIALFEFEGTEDNELGFEKGTEIVITQTYHDSDWTAGYLSNDPNKTEGLFPTKYELQKGFVWESNDEKLKTSILEVTEKGIFSKTQFFKVQTEYSNMTNVVTFSWEDIRWLRSMYEKYYPNVCIAPLIDLKPVERKPFSTLPECRKFTSEHFLNRITEHPILSQSEILSELFSSIDSKSFSKKKKEIEKKSQHFWKLVHHNFPVPDTKLSQQIDLFRKNLAGHSTAVNELYHIQKEVSVNQYLELHNSYVLLAKSFFNWSKIPFDWRTEMPENAKKLDNSIRKAVKEIARSYKDAANKYHEQSDLEMNLLEIFFLEYQQYSSCFKQPFNSRDHSQIKYHEAEQSQLSLEKKSSPSEKDNERLEKARKLVSETKDKADTITYINLVEGEYFRKMRARDTKEKLNAYTDLQIKLYQDLKQIFTKAKNMIQKLILIINSIF